MKKQSETPWFDSYIDLVIKEAEDKYSISGEQLLQGGYTIKVPLDSKLQKTAYQVMKEGSYYPGTDQNAEGSAVFINNKTGGVEAVASAVGITHPKDITVSQLSASRVPHLSRLPYTDRRCRKRNLSHILY